MNGGIVVPIGIVTDEELERELQSYNRKESHPKTIEGTVVEKPSRGRSDGDKNVPDSLRKIIGEESLLNGRQSALEIASQFGISPSQVSAYAKGATSTATYDSPSKSLISHINKARQRAVKKASRTLNAALGAITQEKLDYTDADKLSGIAKDMSVIIKNLEPSQSSGEESSAVKQPQFVIFAPQFRDERTFEHITVQE
jgi:predicted transcriptional regulator